MRPRERTCTLGSIASTARRPTGPWTRQVLALIEANPERRAPDLAASLGRDTLSFKRDVRKLKELGLTESLKIGYRISPRGVRAAARLSRRCAPP